MFVDKNKENIIHFHLIHAISESCQAHTMWEGCNYGGDFRQESAYLGHFHALCPQRTMRSSFKQFVFNDLHV